MLACGRRITALVCVSSVSQPPVPSSEPAPPSDAQPVERPRRRWRWLLLLVPSLFVASVFIVVLALPYLVPGGLIRDEAVRAITDALGVPAEIESIHYDPFTGLVLEGIRLGPPKGFERDVFVAKRLVLTYDLTGALAGRIRIKELTLDTPTVVLETREGRTNVDAVLAHLHQGAEPKVEAPDVPSVGPLLPVDIVLDLLTVGPLQVETVGEGPAIRISQVWLHLKGEAGREVLEMMATLGTKPDPRGNLELKVLAAEPVKANGDLGLAFKVHVRADTQRGLSVKDLDILFDLKPRIQAELGTKVLPELRIDMHVGLRAQPPKDEVLLDALTLAMDGADVLDAQARLMGIRAAIEAEVGKFGAVALSEAVGLIDGAEVPELTVDVKRLSLPLAKVSPFVALFERGAELSGRLGIRDLKVVGQPKDLQFGLPAQMSGFVGFEAFRARLPTQGLDIGGIDGAIQLRRIESEPIFRLDGTFDLAALSVPGLSLGGGMLGVHGHIPRLGMPLSGPALLGLTMAFNDLNTPTARIDRMSFSAQVSGDDLLSERREGPPITLQAQLQTTGVVARTATLAPYRVPSMGLSVNAELDHLVVPTQEPIAMHATLQMPRMSGPQGMLAKGFKVVTALTVEDPRRGMPMALTSKTRVTAKHLGQGPYLLEGVHLQFDTQSPRDPTIGRGPLQGLILPTWLRAQIDFGAERLRGRQQMAGLDTPVSFVTHVHAKPALGQAKLSKIALDLGTALRVQGSMSVKKGLSTRPFARVNLAMPHAKLGPLLATVPSAMKAGFEDALAQGTLKGGLRFEGYPNDLADDLDLRASAVEVEVDLGFEGVGLSSVSNQVAVLGLNGDSSVKLGPSGFGVSNRTTASRIDVGVGEAQRSIVSAAMRQELGYQDGQWRIASTIEASQIQGATGGDDVAGISSELVLHYSVDGDLEVPRLTVRAASAGIDAQVQGRLVRGLYGVLQPELRGEGWIDFDRLVAVLPKIGALKGRLSADFSLRCQGDTAVEVQGGLSMSDFGYKDEVSHIDGMFGRLPLHQMLTLPPPAFDAVVAGSVGSLGDDLEARIKELQDRFMQAKGLFSTEDVILVPPRHADHVALRPYRSRGGARLTARRVTYGRYDMKSLVAEAQWRAGVLRLDHFEAALWNGDLLYDMALQLTPDLDIKAHIRGTFTNLNLDIPYALATGRVPDTSEEGEKYQTSATMDLSFALKERTLNGRIEITKLSQALVKRLFGGLALSGGGQAVEALGWSERAGVRPVAAKIWIAQNLLNVQFEWDRLWLHVYYPELTPLKIAMDTALLFLRPFVIPTFGGLYIIPTVNGTVHRLSLSSFLDQALAEQQPEVRLQALTPYVAAAPE